MLRVGLTGGYATGKSLIANHLAKSGCFVIQADLLGHQVLAPGGQAYQPTVNWLAKIRPDVRVVNTDLTLDRRQLAAIVFTEPALLEQLNSFVHPAVFRLEEEALISFESQHPHGIAVIEAAILIETGRYKAFDRLIVTSCPVEIQISRARERDNVAREEVLRRLARQLPDADRVSFADYVVDTSGTVEATVKQTDAIYVQLRQLAEAPLL